MGSLGARSDDNERNVRHIMGRETRRRTEDKIDTENRTAFQLNQKIQNLGKGDDEASEGGEVPSESSDESAVISKASDEDDELQGVELDKDDLEVVNHGKNGKQV